MKCGSSLLVLPMISLQLASTPLGSLRQPEFLPKARVLPRQPRPLARACT